jgi:hypothetical protein
MYAPVDPSRILQLGEGFMASKTLLSAVELELFTTLGKRTESIGQRQDPPAHRIAFGIASPGALIALVMLTLGGHPPALPGRR